MAIALIKGKKNDVESKVKEAIEEGVKPETILNDGLIAGMSVVGERFRRNLVYVPEVLISARAMKSGMALLAPHLSAGGVKPIAKVVLGTVKGDLHDIGKNLVAMMLQGGGFEIIDLGTDVPAETFVSAVQQHNATIVGMSALLTTTMPYMANVVKAIRDSGLKDVRTMIGGAPVTQQFANDIGADGYAPDAASAVEVATRLVPAKA
ncbi:MAG TPA: corrinoid protein [Phycisphaerae bacterium]|nr:corrinoid protein [Phycisphaerae bacterium]HOJ55576.1 corrinoid protein [Phycisphaerae bacterium]HOL27728.1 corrinoid protein [Phycisphaerae bacterium]HPP21890.1 corrinoid protein [Phycisphaerae bacterium]HPU32485.1 corrinoid protein [Phycisphaerae bacterium]